MAVAKWTKVGEPAPVTNGFWGKNLVLQKFIDHTGAPQNFYLYTLRDSIVVLPITTDGQVLLVREYKQGPDQIMDNALGAYMDQGETPEQTVRREIEGETGFIAGRVISLGPVWIVPRHCSAQVNLFLALDCAPGGQRHLDPTEQIDVLQVPLTEWISTVLSGECTDPTSIVATTRSLFHLGFSLQPPT